LSGLFFGLFQKTVFTHLCYPPTRYINLWLCGRQTDLNVKGVGMGVANFVKNFF